MLRLFANQRRWLSASARGAFEMGTVLERYKPADSYYRGWLSFSQSTLAVVNLRKVLVLTQNPLSPVTLMPESALRQAVGFTVPQFKEEAAEIYAGVGTALATADEATLRKLTTPSCFATMSASLRERPAGQRHKWTTLDVATSVVQVRIGHHASLPERKFAQVTCSIDAKLIWTITDKKGVRIGGLGSKDAPHETVDWWVFERCIAEPPEPPRWRLKERIALPKREEQGGPTLKDAEL